MRNSLCLILFGLLFLPGTSHAQSADTLTLDGATPTLQQDFKAAPQWRGGAVQPNARAKPLSDASFDWAAGYIWDHPPVGSAKPWPQPTSRFSAWTSNNNADADPNGDMNTKLGPELAPLSWNGTLDITARKMPPDIAATVDKSDPHDYLSGSISSFPYSQLYGVFAMTAKLPGGPGVWPAFWLLPVDKSWPPELDVVEVIGRQPATVYTTVHEASQAMHGHGFDTHADLAADFHEYAVDWGPETINWYFDRKLIFSQPTPPELRKPCYILANLAIGKPDNWGGAPDSTTVFPATMQISSIKAWQRPAYQQTEN